MLRMDGLAEEPPRQLSGFGRPDSRTHLTNGMRNKGFINKNPVRTHHSLPQVLRPGGQSSPG